MSVELTRRSRLAESVPNPGTEGAADKRPNNKQTVRPTEPGRLERAIDS
jgi:hypothetical protein